MENWTSFFKNTPDFIWNIVLVLIAIFIGLLIRFILTKSIRLYYRRTKVHTFPEIIKRLYRPAGFFFPLIIINAAIPFMKMDKIPLANTDRIIEVSLMVAFAAMLISTIKVFESVIYHIYDISQENNLKARRIRTQMQFVRQLLVAIIVVLTIAAILLSFENMRKLGTGLLGGVAIGATILGFAAQQSLGNLLAGFQIAFTQPIRIDDVLVVEGEWGRVEEITLTYVVLHIWDQRRLILPISYFIQNPFKIGPEALQTF
ncbi:Membrane protein [Arcticibacter svalbardensis MN12-7]|uniref:Membrane protein n=1 Tax=Arcticibacter svalbardensis MN12-7 TaxID=1150600 RepID=R9H091_9SPHI|nr:mechanosensitive ion channel domain-containing protein [Arcticibacter svalbardensis]EOR94634.1 Membrane protein [Arcticibacter svalbardensis MN12-7]